MDKPRPQNCRIASYNTVMKFLNMRKETEPRQFFFFVKVVISLEICKKKFSITWNLMSIRKKVCLISFTKMQNSCGKKEYF